MGKDDKQLERRVNRLEQRIKDLEQRLEGGATPAKRSAAGKSDKKFREKVDFNFGEEWLNRIGIALLLIGMAFLFKYSIDQGWLIPPVRSGIGILTGIVLLWGGYRIKEKDSTLKQILLGGGIAVFYLTGFATFQLYSFIGGGFVWFFMIAVTLFSLYLSLHQHHQILSVVGTLGALGTPFMLYGGDKNVMGFAAYLTIILAASAFIYFRKGWKGLLWSMVGGGYIVLGVGIANTAFGDQSGDQLSLWSLQAAAIVWMTCCWLLPVYRNTRSNKNADDIDGYFDNLNEYRENSVNLLVYLVPLLMLSLVAGIWEMEMRGAGFIALLIAAISGGLYLPLNRGTTGRLASNHGISALVMLTVALFLLLEGNILFIILTAEATALHYMASQNGAASIKVIAHLLYFMVFFWLLNMLGYSDTQIRFWNLQAFSQLLALAAGGLLIPRWLRKENVGNYYLIACHILFLAWLYQRFMFFENGQAWITLVWGLYAVLLLLLGFVSYGRKVRLAGMVTIFIVVGKLFLIDLSQLQAFWRILLFMGFGIVFLILGYWWQSQSQIKGTENKVSE